MGERRDPAPRFGAEQMDGLRRGHESALRAFLLSRKANPNDVDDLIQRSFEIVWSKRDKVQLEKAKQFLFGVAIRELHAHARKERQRELWRRKEIALLRAQGSAAAAADQHVIEQERAARAAALLEQLPPRARQIIDLVYFQHHSIREAAQIMGIDPSTAYQHEKRARRLLREILESQKSHTSG